MTPVPRTGPTKLRKGDVGVGVRSRGIGARTMAAELNCNWKEALSERECLLGNDSHFSYWASRTNMLASTSLSL